MKTTDLQCFVPRQPNKSLLVESVLELFSAIEIPVENTPGTYQAMCLRFFSTLGPVIYCAIIKCFPLAVCNDCVALPYVNPDFASALKQAFSACNPPDLQLMLSSLSAKVISNQGAVLYCIKSPSRKGYIESVDLCIFLSKVFQQQFSSLYSLTSHVLIELYFSENYQTINEHPFYDVCDLVFAILEGREYLLNAVTEAFEHYNSHSALGLPLPGTGNECKRL